MMKLYSFFLLNLYSEASFAAAFTLLFLSECIGFQTSGIASQKWRPAPTRREQEKWDRAAKAATGGSVSYPHNKLYFFSIYCLRVPFAYNVSLLHFESCLFHYCFPCKRQNQSESASSHCKLEGTLVLQDVMFRDIRRPKGDPEVLAAQSREEYFKVCSDI